jgi:hypothetical protein
LTPVHFDFAKHFFLALTAISSLAVVAALAAIAAETPLETYESKYYIIHTDLPQTEAREAQLRMTRMVEQYRQLNPAAAAKLKTPLPFYLYKNIADYTKAVGVEGSGGYFDGEKLLAAVHRSENGAIAPSTWQIVQHEGFHQFAHAVIGGEIPMWADEGLAEYYGQAIFTGDGFITGLIPQSRLIRTRALLLSGDAKPFAQFIVLPRDQWNAKVEMKNYDQAWSLVHFLMHGEEGKLQKPFNDFLEDIAKGESAERSYHARFDEIPDLERRYRKWWLGLPDYPSSQDYARATLSTLTSFLARAHQQNQTFANFEDFTQTLAQNLKQPPENWLPPTLFTTAVDEANRMCQAGDTFALTQSAAHLPSITLTQKSGAKLIGQFKINKQGHIESVQANLNH